MPTRPYVSILAEINENADRILGAALEKYGLEHSKDDFILVEVGNFFVKIGKKRLKLEFFVKNF